MPRMSAPPHGRNEKKKGSGRPVSWFFLEIWLGRASQSGEPRRHALAQRLGAALDVDDLPGHERSVLATQKSNHVGDITWHTDPTERDVLGPHALVFLGLDAAP